MKEVISLLRRGLGDFSNICVMFGAMPAFTYERV